MYTKTISTKILSIFLSVTFLALAFATPASAAADTCTWTGTSTNLWSNGANWIGCDNGGVPENGDTLIFPAAAANTTNTNDLIGLNLNEIIITGGSYSLSGNALTLTPLSPYAIELLSNAITYNIPTTISAASGSKYIVSSGTSNAINSNITLAMAGADINFTAGAAPEDLSILGSISGNAANVNFASGGSGLVTINNAAPNTFTTSAYVQASGDAHISCGTSTCFGNSANDLNLFDEVTLDIKNPTTNIANTIIFLGSLQANVTFNSSSTISGDLVLTNNVQFETTANASVNINGNVALGTSKTATFFGTSNPGFQRFIINGIVSGDGQVGVDEVRIELHGANTYTGTTTIQSGGVIQNYNATGLGTIAGDTIVENGGSLSGVGNLTIDEDIDIEANGNSAFVGALRNDAGDQTYTGTISLTGDMSIFAPGPGSIIYFSGDIVGSGDLIMHRDGFVPGGLIIFNGSGTNSYSGKTIIRGSYLYVARTGGIGVPNDLDILATSINNSFVSISDAGGDQIADDALITLTNSGANKATFEPDAQLEIVGMIVGDGHIESDGPSYGISVGGANMSGTFTGSFDDESGVISKVGSGTWTLSGATYPGDPATPFEIYLENGKIIWNSTLPAMPIEIDGGTLNGTGSTGDVLGTSGRLNAGNSPGCLTVASLTLASGFNFDQEIESSSACSGYDQVISTGAVDLGSGVANFSLTLNAINSVGTVYTVIEGTSVTGTFAGLADGTVVSASNGVKLRINYTASTVTLTVVEVPVISSTGPTAGSTLPTTGSNVGDIVIVSLILIFLGFIIVRSKRRRLQIV